MTLAADSAANRIACAVNDALHDVVTAPVVIELHGAYVDGEQLSREEAMTYRATSGEVLKLVWEQ